MKKIIVGNWKMNPQRIKDARVLAHQVEQRLLAIDRTRVDVVICPPFIFLPAVRHATHFVSLGAQDISPKDEGPHTGEISATQLADSGVRYVIVGHSERRALGENDVLVNQKVKAALEANIHPVVCVGFGTKKSHKVGTVKRIVLAQVKKALKGISGAQKKITIAYEPVWAISKGVGTGTAANPKHAEEIIQYIKGTQKGIRTIYGGSVDGANAEDFAKVKIDGVLPGGASLVPDQFVQIVKAFIN